MLRTLSHNPELLFQAEDLSGRKMITSATGLAFLIDALPRTRKRLFLSTKVTIQAFPVIPATVSASQSPILTLLFAASGRSSIGWLIGIFPLRSTQPFLCLLLPLCRSLLMPPLFP